MQYLPFDHNEVKSEINNRESMWKLNNTFCNNEWIKEKTHKVN
jgi:hypothetical protein